jgi:hypothetical protein
MGKAISTAASQPVSRVGWTNVKKNTAGNFAKEKGMLRGSKGQN